MPRGGPAKNQPRIVYPPGVKEVTDDISTDDLVRRLKECAQAFQNMSQDDDNTLYIPLALHLCSDSFLEHQSKDVRLLIACCIADVFRVFAPDAPYKDPEQLKVIFQFFIEQLRGLEDPKDPTFKRYFYLLENLAWVKSFNICIELEENQQIFCQLFSLMFKIVNDNHSQKVKNFMLDMMCPLISEADTVSQELLDIILLQIIDPIKTHNKNAYNLAKDILQKTANTIEPYIQGYFNNTLILGKSSQNEVDRRIYDILYELNQLCPSMLVSVLPQLEFKLKSNEEKERLEVTRLLARMFSDKDSNLAVRNKALWTCFLGRFNDISLSVRLRCVQYSMHFLVNHPELCDDITEQLRQRQHDPDETVRYEVVMSIISAAKKDFSSVNDDLLNFVKERTLDKKFKIRKEALLGLAVLYKQHMSSPNIPESTLKCISWIKNKVLHVYYQTALEDRLLVERILHTCLVPYQLPLEERMKKLYQLFATVDDHAVRAFHELLKCQNVVRGHVRGIMEILQQPKTDEREKTLNNKIVILSKNLLDQVKSQEMIKKLCDLLENNPKLRAHMDTILSCTSSCSEAEQSVKEVLKSLGFPVQTNIFYMTIKQLLERVAPVMIDRSGIKQVISYVKNTLMENGDIDHQLGLNKNSSHRGLQLLLIFSSVFTGAFHGDEVYNDLLSFLKSDDEVASEITLQIFTNIGGDLEVTNPNIAQRLLPVLQHFVENGTVKQAKYAVACLNAISSNKERVFGQIIDRLKQHLTLQSQYFRTALVSMGHIAFHCAELFSPQIKSIVAKIVVKELLMVDREPPRTVLDIWGPYDSLPEETKMKIEGMKMMVRWLVGLKTNTQPGVSALRLLSTVILHQGDLMEREHVSAMEKSWLRLTAATSMLKLCQESVYSEVITLEQFQIMALVINDECYQVREKFAQKLHKGLISMKLPLEFMAIFALGGLEKVRDLKGHFKHYLLANINKRREFIKQHPVSAVKMFSVLPDYVLPYAIHLLAHDPSFKRYDDVNSLQRLRECLWFLMEPLIIKNENYSFSFFKRLIENIKQTKDKQAPNDDIANLKLYAVCDLALGLVMSKTTSFVLKDFPVEPCLPSRLYTDPDKNYSNLKTYLPPELAFTPPKKSGIEMEMFRANSAKPRVDDSSGGGDGNRRAIGRGPQRPRNAQNGGTTTQTVIIMETTTAAPVVATAATTEQTKSKVVEVVAAATSPTQQQQQQQLSPDSGKVVVKKVSAGTQFNSADSELSNQSTASTPDSPVTKKDSSGSSEGSKVTSATQASSEVAVRRSSRVAARREGLSGSSDSPVKKEAFKSQGMKVIVHFDKETGKTLERKVKETLPSDNEDNDDDEKMEVSDSDENKTPSSAGGSTNTRNKEADAATTVSDKKDTSVGMDVDEVDDDGSMVSHVDESSDTSLGRSPTKRALSPVRSDAGTPPSKKSRPSYWSTPVASAKTTQTTENKDKSPIVIVVKSCEKSSSASEPGSASSSPQKAAVAETTAATPSTPTSPTAVSTSSSTSTAAAAAATSPTTSSSSSTTVVARQSPRLKAAKEAQDKVRPLRSAAKAGAAQISALSSRSSSSKGKVHGVADHSARRATRGASKRNGSVTSTTWRSSIARAISTLTNSKSSIVTRCRTK